MYRMSPLTLPLVGALLLFATRSAFAEWPPHPGAAQPETHTMTVYNGNHAVRRTFVRQDGSWQSPDVVEACNVVCDRPPAGSFANCAAPVGCHRPRPGCAPVRRGCSAPPPPCYGGAFMSMPISH